MNKGSPGKLLSLLFPSGAACGFADVTVAAVADFANASFFAELLSDGVSRHRDPRIIVRVDRFAKVDRVF